MNYPYYIVPAVEEFRQSDPFGERAKRLRLLITVNIGDPKTLQNLFSEGEETEVTESGELPTGSFGTIDNFLNKFGGNGMAIGYMATQKEEQEQPVSLKELIKNKRYQEAIELIEAQNLNNTQKSIYFAHQMRFIKKLIAIDNQRTKTNHG